MTTGVIGRRVEAMEDVDATFWSGCADGTLLLQECADCGTWQFYPRHLCSACWSTSLVWRAASGSARLETFSVVSRGAAEFHDVTPYAVVIVRLDEGPTLMSSMFGVAEQHLRVGMPVTVAFARRHGRTLPVFSQPVAER